MIIKLFNIFIAIIIILTMHVNCFLFVECQDCGRDPKREQLIQIYLMFYVELSKNTSNIKIKNNNSFGTLEINLQGDTESVTEGATCKKFTIQRETLGKYKLTSSVRGTIIDQESYDFKGIFNDGIFIRENSTLIPSTEGCNIFDGAQGKILHQTSCD